MCSIYLRKVTDGAALVAHVAWEEPPQRIPLILTVVAVSLLAVGSVRDDAALRVVICILCSTVQ
jgi:hypothetical protein